MPNVSRRNKPPWSPASAVIANCGFCSIAGSSRRPARSGHRCLGRGGHRQVAAHRPAARAAARQCACQFAAAMRAASPQQPASSDDRSLTAGRRLRVGRHAGGQAHEDRAIAGNGRQQRRRAAGGGASVGAVRRPLCVPGDLARAAKGVDAGIADRTKCSVWRRSCHPSGR